MDRVKMVDLQSQYLRIKPEIDEAISNVLNSTAFIQGPQVSEFSQSLSNYLGVKAVITCANGTDALQIAMMALNFKAGDEIILPVHTYVATAEVIALLGLVPVFTDVDAETFNIDVVNLEDKITSKTVCIVPVHLYGQCADMDPILKLAAKYNIHIIEDAAQALGAVYTFPDGRQAKAGTMGTIGTTSFFPSKNLGCYGDGGALFTNDGELAEKIKMIANHGQKRKYFHEVVGVNSRLDTLQAAILSVKLRYLSQYEESRNNVAEFYDRNLFGNKVKTPVRSVFSTHVFHQYTLRVKKRDELKSYMESKGIPSMIYYPLPLHFQNAYKRDKYPVGSFPITELLSQEVISLPIHTEMKVEEIQYICDTINSFY